MVYEWSADFCKEVLKMASANIKQHFRQDEAPLVDQLSGWIATAESQYRPVLTPFLNPRQRYIAQTLANRSDVIKMAASGIFKDAEMQRVLFFPTYYSPTDHDFEIQLMNIKYPVKFAEIHHRDILGTMLGSGLKRDAFGDIVNSGTTWQITIDARMTNFAVQNVDRIGRVKASLVPIDVDEVVIPQSDWEEPMSTTVQSLRLDAIVSAAFHYSRQRTKTTIERGLVRLNWEEIDRPDYPVVVHDIMSIRHAGRIRIDEVNGLTKKQKQRVVISVIHA